MGRLLRRRADGKCEYISVVMARTEARFEGMEEYIRQKQNTLGIG